MNKEGVTEWFTIQTRDRFGNELDSSIDPSSDLIVTMKGVVDECQVNSGSAHEIPIKILNRQPNTDGIYLMEYDPTATGSYEISTKIITSGGLLATYYKTMDLKDPVLASKTNIHDDTYHDPYWCDGLVDGNFSTAWTFGPVTSCDPTIADCGCDSTRLDTSLDFSWGVTLFFLIEKYSFRCLKLCFSIKTYSL